MPSHAAWTEPSESTAVSLRLFLLLAALKLALHVPVLSRYDYHGDELYFIQCGLHLDWGYVDHPPLVVWLVRLTGEVFGYSLPALRALPLLAGVWLIYLAMRMAARLGGGAPAQAIAGAAVLLAPAYLRMATLVNIPAFEQVLWALATLCFLDLIQRDDRVQMRNLGLLVGVGLLLKYTFLLFAAAYAVALLLHRREYFADRRLWLGGGLALLLWSPNLVWQIDHEWAHLQFLHNISQPDGMIGREPRVLFLAGQILYFNPAGVLVWAAGLWALWQNATLRPAVWLYVVPLVLLFITNGKPYYLAPAYPLLFAAGGVFWQARLTTARGWISLIGSMTVVGGFFAFLSLPYLSLEKMDRTIDALLLGIVPAIGLTHDYHNQLGWRHYYPALHEIYAKLPAEDQPGTIIITAYYRQASGLRFLAMRPGGEGELPPGQLPAVFSPHLTYYFWPPEFADVERALVLSIPREVLEPYFDVVEKLADIEPPALGRTETDSVYLVGRPKRPWSEIWRELVWFHNSPYRAIQRTARRMHPTSGLLPRSIG
jgi:hypothetical protein